MKAPAFGSGPAPESSDEPKVLEIVKLLLDRGIDINAVDNTGRTAVTGAADAQYSSVVQFLVANGAKPPENPAPSRRGRGGG
jgi:ankyrin repeat protein